MLSLTEQLVLVRVIEHSGMETEERRVWQMKLNVLSQHQTGVTECTHYSLPSLDTPKLELKVITHKCIAIRLNLF